MNFSLTGWKLKYALAGAAIVPLFGRVALNGTGHEHDLYRYIVPLLVGSVAGFLVGKFRDGVEERNARLRQELRRSEELSHNLRENEEYLRALLDNAPLPIYLKEADGLRYFMVNRVAEKIISLRAEQIVGNTDFDLLPGDIAEMVTDQDRQVMEADSALQFDTEMVLGGRKYNFVTCKFPLHDSEGNIYAVGGMCIDITVRKEAEEKLAEQEERLAVTLRNIGDAVIAVDVEGRVTLVNAAAERLTGWSQSEALDRFLHDMLRFENEQGDELNNLVGAVITYNKLMCLPRDTLLVARDGTRRHIEDTWAPICDRAGEIIGVVLTFRDVTHEREMEKELLKTQKLESLGVLAGGIAHDFNNILVGIMGNINLAIMDLEKDKPVTELLENAQKAARRAQDLTRQLLTFAKGGKPVKKIAELPGIITEAADLMLHGSNIVAQYDLPDDLWKVEVDTGQFSQVIQNLVINARQAMPSGGKLEISSRNVVADQDVFLRTGLAPGRYVRLRIKDQGVGMPKNIMDRIFDPYFTTKQRGSGLGLSVVHSIITKHGGHISVDSEPGMGTTFTIMLPAVESDVSGALDGTDDASPAPGASDRTVLVMDDEEMVREIACQMLEHFGYQALQATNGEEVLAIYRERKEQGQPIYAVIMDLTVPGGMGGRECAQRLLEYDPDARCIVSSGYSNDAVMADAEAHGFVASLAKPFDINEFRQVLLMLERQEADA